MAARHLETLLTFRAEPPLLPEACPAPCSAPRRCIHLLETREACGAVQLRADGSGRVQLGRGGSVAATPARAVLLSARQG